MSSLIPNPTFDLKTEFKTMIPSHKTLEAYWILDFVNPNKTLGIVSTGHEGIELGKLESDIIVYMPKETPEKIVDKTRNVTNKVTLVGKNYPECYLAAVDIIDSDSDKMLNVSAGMLTKHIAHKTVMEILLREYTPDYVFLADSNMDFTVGLLESLNENERGDITVVSCVLPDNFTLSPRFNTVYDHKPFFTGFSFLGHDNPGLNARYRLYNNLVTKTVTSPDYCFAKYNPHYPDIDPMNYLPMEISTKFNKDSKKLILLTGDSLLK